MKQAILECSRRCVVVELPGKKTAGDGMVDLPATYSCPEWSGSSSIFLKLTTVAPSPYMCVCASVFWIQPTFHGFFLGIDIASPISADKQRMHAMAPTHPNLGTTSSP